MHRFCNIFIESIIQTRPSIIYTTKSAPVDDLWRKEIFPEYKSTFVQSNQYPIYADNCQLLDELQDQFPIMHQMTSPKNEAGDIASSIIKSYTNHNDEIYLLSDSKKSQQVLSYNDYQNDEQRNINYMKTTRQDDDEEDHELNFKFIQTSNNLFELSSNTLIPDYFAFVGISTDNISGIKGIGKKRALQLLQFGDIEYLLNNDEWKQKITAKTVRKAMEDDTNRDKLRLFKKLIPFKDNIEFDKILMEQMPELADEYFDINDTLSLLNMIKPFAEKWRLNAILWRQRNLEYQHKKAQMTEMSEQMQAMEAMRQ